MKKLRILTFILVGSFIMVACNEESLTDVIDYIMSEEASSENQSRGDHIHAVTPLEDGEASVTVFDVGQGDSALIQSKHSAILVDTGRHDSDIIFDHLEFEGVDHLDLLILTHPHADHIGNADEIVRQYEPDTVWIDGNETTSQVFERLVDSLLESEAEVIEPIAGEKYNEGEFSLEVLNPTDELTGDLNNDSISFRLTFGEMSFLFTGDAEEKAERLMVESGMELSSDILIMGHHGSNTSSNDFFLEKVQPRVAIYSAGENNSYGHPGEEALQRVEEVGASLYGTLDNGTIIVRTDGQNLGIGPEY